MRMAASLAYYALFSLAPILILTATVATWVWGDNQAQQNIVRQVALLAGLDTANVVEAILASAKREHVGWSGFLIGGLALLIGASGIFFELQESLNLIWNVPPPSNTSWKRTLERRALPFVLVLAGGFVLGTLFTFTAALTAMAEHLSQLLPAPATAMQVWNSSLSIVVTTILFALIMKVLPDARIAWTDVWIGAFVTAVLFEAGKTGISLYLARSGMASAFGAAASVAALLAWIYYSAILFFLGAEFTQVYACQCGSWKECEPIPRKQGKFFRV